LCAAGSLGNAGGADKGAAVAGARCSDCGEEDGSGCSATGRCTAGASAGAADDGASGWESTYVVTLPGSRGSCVRVGARWAAAAFSSVLCAASPAASSSSVPCTFLSALCSSLLLSSSNMSFSASSSASSSAPAKVPSSSSCSSCCAGAVASGDASSSRCRGTLLRAASPPAPMIRLFPSCWAARSALGRGSRLLSPSGKAGKRAPPACRPALSRIRSCFSSPSYAADNLPHAAGRATRTRAPAGTVPQITVRQQKGVMHRKCAGGTPSHAKIPLSGQNTAHGHTPKATCAGCRADGSHGARTAQRRTNARRS